MVVVVVVIVVAGWGGDAMVVGGGQGWDVGGCVAGRKSRPTLAVKRRCGGEVIAAQCGQRQLFGLYVVWLNRVLHQRGCGWGGI